MDLRDETRALESEGAAPDEAMILALRERVDRLSLALGYYANPQNWNPSGHRRALVGEPDNTNDPGWTVAAKAMESC
jgi:hypothetical protein